MRAVSTLIFIIAWVSPALAQLPGPEAAGVRGEVPGTRKRLADAEQLLIAGKATDARDAILKVLDDAGDDLILVEGGRYVSARWFAQRLLARLPAEPLNAYPRPHRRGRAEAARRWPHATAIRGPFKN